MFLRFLYSLHTAVGWFSKSVPSWFHILTQSEIVVNSYSSSSSRMRVINHNWSATKQRLHPQSVAEISRHSVFVRGQDSTMWASFWSRHKDTDQCLQVAISFCRHRSVPVPCKNGSAQTTVAREVETWLPDCGIAH